MKKRIYIPTELSIATSIGTEGNALNTALKSVIGNTIPSCVKNDTDTCRIDGNGTVYSVSTTQAGNYFTVKTSDGNLYTYNYNGFVGTRGADNSYYRWKCTVMTRYLDYYPETGKVIINLAEVGTAELHLKPEDGMKVVIEVSHSSYTSIVHTELTTVKETTRVGELIKDSTPEYSATAMYVVGDFVYHDNKLYTCTTAIAEGGESWTVEHWKAIPNVSVLKADILDSVEVTRVSGEEETVLEQVDGNGNVYTAETVVTNQGGILTVSNSPESFTNGVYQYSGYDEATNTYTWSLSTYTISYNATSKKLQNNWSSLSNVTMTEESPLVDGARFVINGETVGSFETYDSRGNFVKFVHTPQSSSSEYSKTAKLIRGTMSGDFTEAQKSSLLSPVTAQVEKKVDAVVKSTAVVGIRKLEWTKTGETADSYALTEDESGVAQYSCRYPRGDEGEVLGYLKANYESVPDKFTCWFERGGDTYDTREYSKNGTSYVYVDESAGSLSLEPETVAEYDTTTAKNANQLGGVEASEYAVKGDIRYSASSVNLTAKQSELDPEQIGTFIHINSNSVNSVVFNTDNYSTPAGGFVLVLKGFSKTISTGDEAGNVYDSILCVRTPAASDTKKPSSYGFVVLDKDQNSLDLVVEEGSLPTTGLEDDSLYRFVFSTIIKDPSSPAQLRVNLSIKKIELS